VTTQPASGVFQLRFGHQAAPAAQGILTSAADFDFQGFDGWILKPMPGEFRPRPYKLPGFSAERTFAVLGHRHGKPPVVCLNCPPFPTTACFNEMGMEARDGRVKMLKKSVGKTFIREALFPEIFGLIVFSQCCRVQCGNEGE
jgi:hypothetical protein